MLEHVRERGFSCESCGSTGFEVGRSMELGHIWHNEEPGNYMVALRCENCGAPTGIRMHESWFSRGAALE